MKEEELNYYRLEESFKAMCKEDKFDKFMSNFVLGLMVICGIISLPVIIPFWFVGWSFNKLNDRFKWF